MTKECQVSFYNDFKDSLCYPFKDSEWAAKLWPLPLITLIPVIGLLSVILLKGWRFEMVKRLSAGDVTLPPFDPVIMFKRGLLLWCVMTAHIFVPGILCAILGIGGPIGFVQDLYQILANGFSDWAQSEPKDWAFSILIYFIWAIISFPVFQAGMIRYANSGDWKTLLNVALNFALFVKYIHYFIKFYLSWLALIVLIAVLDSALAITGFGILLIPTVSIVGYYISSAYDLGVLAHKINSKEQNVQYSL